MQKPWSYTPICRFLQGIWLHTQREDRANTFSLCLPWETIAAVMMHYKNTKVNVCSSDGDTDFFDIVTDGLQRDTLAPYRFIICLRTSDVDRFNERKWPYTGKGKKQTIPCTNYYGCGLHWWHSVSCKYTQNNFPDHHYIYTDGSKQGIQVGFVAIFQIQELFKHFLNDSSIYSAEVTAIDLAMNIIANHKSSKFIIYSDSKSVLQAL